MQKKLSNINRGQLIGLLFSNDTSVAKVAKILKVSRQAVYDLMAKHGVSFSRELKTDYTKTTITTEN